ncbi:MAG: hypothetical protein ACJAWL_002972 [Motiliproteus sp.]|jgi:hypothetical protein
MLNGDLKDIALARLKKSESEYNKKAEELQKSAIVLTSLRFSISSKLISDVELFINSLSNYPKILDKSYSKYQSVFYTFRSVFKELETEDVDTGIQAAKGSASGVAVGAGVAAFAPTAAMAVASTFGVASTGTAISALGGAAATNAALAWLGGGALVAGGGGMAGGGALLALAGPIGWTIGAASLAGGIFWKRSKNAKIGNEADSIHKKLQKGLAEFKTGLSNVRNLISLTNTHSSGVESILHELTNNAPNDYREYESTHKNQLASLVNHIQSLSVILNKKAI